MQDIASPDDVHVVVDTETTGFDSKVERIKAIAGAGGTMRHGVTRGFKSYLDVEGRRSSPDAMQVHRIPDEVTGTLAEYEALVMLDAMTKDATIVIQNKAFDVPFLIEAYNRQFMTLPPWLQDGGASIVDTMDLGRRRFPGRQLNLDNLGRLVNADPAMLKRRETRHDALEDCELTFEIWRRLMTPTTLELTTARTAPPTIDASSIKTTEAPDWL